MMKEKISLLPVVMLLIVVSGANAQLIGIDFNSQFSVYSIDTTYGTAGIMEDVFSGYLDDITVRSAAFYNDTADAYVYLYQIINQSSAILHRFTVNPFTGLEPGSSMEFINANEPTGFDPGDVSPYLATYDGNGPTAGFTYIEISPSDGIAPGETSNIMFIESILGPSLVPGFVMDGGTSAGLVIAPVPEPATLMLFGLGSLIFARKRRKA